MTSLVWLARGESSCRNYYVVSGAGSQCHASHPTWESSPWPVHLTLGTFSRRHILRFPKQYDGRAAHYSVSQLCRRIRWAWHFRDDVGPRPDCRRLIKRPVKPFSGALHAEVESLCFQASSALKDHIVALNRRLLCTARSHAGPPAFARFALRWIKSRHLAIDLADKEGTFVLYQAEIRSQLINTQLVKTAYRCVGTTTVARRS